MVKFLTSILFISSALFADGSLFEEDTQSHPIMSDSVVGTLSQLSVQVKVVTRKQHMGWGHSNTEVSINWGENTQVVVERVSPGVKVQINSNSIEIIEFGDRHMGETYERHQEFQYNTASDKFDMVKEWNVNRWEIYIDSVKDYLSRGDFTAAIELVSERGTSPNGGHTYENERFFELFVKAAHREALAKWRSGDKAGARKIVLSLGEVPTWGWSDEPEERKLTFPSSSNEEQMSSVNATPGNIQLFNDFGFFLFESEHYRLAESLLLQVKYADPERAVVYINLGDLYVSHPELLENGSVGYDSYYKTYCQLMIQKGKQARIPKRLHEYIPQ